MSVGGWHAEKVEKVEKSKRIATMEIAGTKGMKMVALGHMALGPIRFSSSNLLSFCASVEHGGVPCIEVFVPREMHVDATKFGWPCDTVSENEKLSIAGFWQRF